MDCDPNDMRKRAGRWRSLQEVLVPKLNVPVGRGDCRDAGQRQRRRENMFAEASVWVLRIKRIDQQCVTSLNLDRLKRRIQYWCDAHRTWNSQIRHDGRPREAMRSESCCMLGTRKSRVALLYVIIRLTFGLGSSGLRLLGFDSAMVLEPTPSFHCFLTAASFDFDFFHDLARAMSSG